MEQQQAPMVWGMQDASFESRIDTTSDSKSIEFDSPDYFRKLAIELRKEGSKSQQMNSLERKKNECSEGISNDAFSSMEDQYFSESDEEYEELITTEGLEEDCLNHKTKNIDTADDHGCGAAALRRTRSTGDQLLLMSSYASQRKNNSDAMQNGLFSPSMQMKNQSLSSGLQEKDLKLMNNNKPLAVKNCVMPQEEAASQIDGTTNTISMLQKASGISNSAVKQLEKLAILHKSSGASFESRSASNAIMMPMFRRDSSGSGVEVTHRPIPMSSGSMFLRRASLDGSSTSFNSNLSNSNQSVSHESSWNEKWNQMQSSTVMQRCPPRRTHSLDPSASLSSSFVFHKKSQIRKISYNQALDQENDLNKDETQDSDSNKSTNNSEITNESSDDNNQKSELNVNQGPPEQNEEEGSNPSSAQNEEEEGSNPSSAQNEEEEVKETQSSATRFRERRTPIQRCHSTDGDLLSMVSSVRRNQNFSPGTHVNVYWKGATKDKTRKPISRKEAKLKPKDERAEEAKLKIARESTRESLLDISPTSSFSTDETKNSKKKTRKSKSKTKGSVKRKPQTSSSELKTKTEESEVGAKAENTIEGNTDSDNYDLVTEKEASAIPNMCNTLPAPPLRRSHSTDGDLLYMSSRISVRHRKRISNHCWDMNIGSGAKAENEIDALVDKLNEDLRREQEELKQEQERFRHSVKMVELKDKMEEYKSRQLSSSSRRLSNDSNEKKGKNRRTSNFSRSKVGRAHSSDGHLFSMASSLRARRKGNVANAGKDDGERKLTSSRKGNDSEEDSKNVLSKHNHEQNNRFPNRLSTMDTENEVGSVFDDQAKVDANEIDSRKVMGEINNNAQNAVRQRNNSQQEGINSSNGEENSEAMEITTAVQKPTQIIFKEETQGKSAMVESNSSSKNQDDHAMEEDDQTTEEINTSVLKSIQVSAKLDSQEMSVEEESESSNGKQEDKTTEEINTSVQKLRQMSAKLDSQGTRSLEECNSSSIEQITPKKKDDSSVDEEDEYNLRTLSTVNNIDSSNDDSQSKAINRPETGWNVNFLRGAAFIVGVWTELSLNEKSRVISFQHDDGGQINVHYTTKSIEIAPSQGEALIHRRECNDKDLRDILTKSSCSVFTETSLKDKQSADGKNNELEHYVEQNESETSVVSSSVDRVSTLLNQSSEVPADRVKKQTTKSKTNAPISRCEDEKKITWLRSNNHACSVLYHEVEDNFRRAPLRRAHSTDGSLLRDMASSVRGGRKSRTYATMNCSEAKGTEESFAEYLARYEKEKAEKKKAEEEIGEKKDETKYIDADESEISKEEVVDKYNPKKSKKKCKSSKTKNGQPKEAPSFDWVKFSETNCPTSSNDESENMVKPTVLRRAHSTDDHLLRGMASSVRKGKRTERKFASMMISSVKMETQLKDQHTDEVGFIQNSSTEEQQGLTQPEDDTCIGNEKGSEKSISKIVPKENFVLDIRDHPQIIREENVVLVTSNHLESNTLLEKKDLKMTRHKMSVSDSTSTTEKQKTETDIIDKNEAENSKKKKSKKLKNKSKGKSRSSREKGVRRAHSSDGMLLSMKSSLREIDEAQIELVNSRWEGKAQNNSPAPAVAPVAPTPPRSPLINPLPADAPIPVITEKPVNLRNSSAGEFKSPRIQHSEEAELNNQESVNTESVPEEDSSQYISNHDKDFAENCMNTANIQESLSEKLEEVGKEKEKEEIEEVEEEMEELEEEMEEFEEEMDELEEEMEDAKEEMEDAEEEMEEIEEGIEGVKGGDVTKSKKKKSLIGRMKIRRAYSSDGLLLAMASRLRRKGDDNRKISPSAFANVRWEQDRTKNESSDQKSKQYDKENEAINSKVVMKEKLPPNEDEGLSLDMSFKDHMSNFQKENNPTIAMDSVKNDNSKQRDNEEFTGIEQDDEEQLLLPSSESDANQKKIMSRPTLEKPIDIMKKWSSFRRKKQENHKLLNDAWDEEEDINILSDFSGKSKQNSISNQHPAIENEFTIRKTQKASDCISNEVEKNSQAIPRGTIAPSDSDPKIPDAPVLVRTATLAAEEAIEPEPTREKRRSSTDPSLKNQEQPEPEVETKSTMARSSTAPSLNKITKLAAGPLRINANFERKKDKKSRKGATPKINAFFPLLRSVPESNLSDCIDKTNSSESNPTSSGVNPSSPVNSAIEEKTEKSSSASALSESDVNSDLRFSCETKNETTNKTKNAKQDSSKSNARAPMRRPRRTLSPSETEEEKKDNSSESMPLPTAIRRLPPADPRKRLPQQVNQDQNVTMARTQRMANTLSTSGSDKVRRLPGRTKSAHEDVRRRIPNRTISGHEDVRRLPNRATTGQQKARKLPSRATSGHEKLVRRPPVRTSAPSAPGTKGYARKFGR